jgi:hypothetical protein
MAILLKVGWFLNARMHFDFHMLTCQITTICA